MVATSKYSMEYSSIYTLYTLSIEYSHGHFHGPMGLYDEIPRSTGTEALNILTKSA